MKNSNKLFSLSTLAVAAMLVMSASSAYADDDFGKSLAGDVKNFYNKIDKSGKSDDNGGFGNFGNSGNSGKSSSSSANSSQAGMEVDGDHVEGHPELVAQRLGKIPHVTRAMPSSSIRQGSFLQQTAQAIANPVNPVNPVATTTLPVTSQPALVGVSGGGYAPDFGSYGGGGYTPVAVSYAGGANTVEALAPSAPVDFGTSYTFNGQNALDRLSAAAADASGTLNSGGFASNQPNQYTPAFDASYSTPADASYTAYVEPGISGYTPYVDPVSSGVDMTYLMEGGGSCDFCESGAYTGGEGTASGAGD